MHAGTVDRDGFQLAWVREGQGMPMLVLGASRFYPRYFPASMRKHFDMVFCDLRQWVSTPDGFDIETISLNTFTDDVEAVRVAAGLERPIVAGTSQHGSIALAYAQRFPERVRGVLAVVPNPPEHGQVGLPSPEEFFEQDATPERKAAHARNLATRRTVADAVTSEDFIYNYVSSDARGWYDQDFDCSYLWDGVEINLAVMDQLFEPAGLGDWDVSNDAVPTFLAMGRYDYDHPYYLWDRPRERLSPLTYRMYERSGHHPPVEQPEEFASDVLAWTVALPE